MVILYLVAIFVVFMALLATIGGALMYFGIFERIEVSTGATPYPFGGVEIAYKSVKGKPADSSYIFTEVCSIVPKQTTFGIFLELEESPDSTLPLPAEQRKARARAFSTGFDPSTDECHYIVGVITTESNGTTSLINKTDRDLLTEKGFKFAHLPSSENVVYTSFPFRGIISVVVGIRRVYPALIKYISEHRLCAYPCMEFYNRDTIYYILPLSQQDQFVALFEAAEEPVATPDVAPDVDDEETEIDEEADEDESGDSSDNTTSSFEEL